MLKMLNASTLELDDTREAVAEILSQLDEAGGWGENAAGFITCSYDYIETGIVGAICEALPFDVVGCTTLTNANDREAGTMLLCLSVLTADDCSFATVQTDPLHNGLHPIAEAYREAAGLLPEEPRLVLAFFPMMASLGGELMLDALDEATDGVPIFGTIGCDFDTTSYRHTYTIHKGACAQDRMAMLLVGGNVHPRFVVTSTSDQNLQKQQAVITASEGSVLQKVNDLSARDYFTSIGLLQGGSLDGMCSVPFVVNYNDGTQPVARAIYSLTEDGAAVCGGRMPKGGTLSIGRMDIDDILLTAKESLNRLLESGDAHGVITFPCLGRNMVLAMDPLAEVERVREVLGTDLPWHLAYSGGEVCPVYSGDRTANRFHNFTFIACAI